MDGHGRNCGESQLLEAQTGAQGGALGGLRFHCSGKLRERRLEMLPGTLGTLGCGLQLCVDRWLPPSNDGPICIIVHKKVCTPSPEYVDVSRLPSPGMVMLTLMLSPPRRPTTAQFTGACVWGFAPSLSFGRASGADGMNAHARPKRSCATVQTTCRGSPRANGEWV